MEYLKNLLKIITENRVLMLSMSLDNGGTHQLLLLVKRSKQESIEHNIEIIRMSFPFTHVAFSSSVPPLYHTWLITPAYFFSSMMSSSFEKLKMLFLAYRSILNPSRRNSCPNLLPPPPPYLLNNVGVLLLH